MTSTRTRRAGPGESAGSERRRELIGVATDAFYRLGFGSAAMRDIAAEVRFTQAAIYYHFRNKEEILFAIIDGFTDFLYATLAKTFCAASDPAQGLRQGMHAHILLSERRYREIKLVIEDKRFLSPEHRAIITEKENAIYQLYKSRVASLTGSGRARKLDASAVTFAMLGVINYFYHWFRPRGRLRLAQVARDSIDVLLDGLLLPEPKTLRAGGKTGLSKVRVPPSRP